MNAPNAQPQREAGAPHAPCVASTKCSSRATLWLCALLGLCWVMAGNSTALGAWLEGGFAFRRSIDVAWEPEKTSGEDVAVAEFYTAGRQQPDGRDLRMAGEDGRAIPFRVLQIGPGDWARVIFALRKGERKYYVYFGNAEPPAPATTLDDLDIRAGLLLEMRRWSGGAPNSFAEMEKAWERNLTVIGRTMIERPFLGLNPFGEQQQTISRISGALFAPMDGEYQFAASADDRGALYLDGKPVLFVPGAAGDMRFNVKLQLPRGRHELVFYHVNTGGDGRLAVVWRRPDMKQADIISRESFGLVRWGEAGPLEELKKRLTADFKVEYLGECFCAGNYSHRVRFTAVAPKVSETPKYEWDFGDGQTASSAQVDHVFLTDGIYPIRLTLRVGSNNDTQTSQVSVTRQYARLDKPPGDEPPLQSKIVSGYNVGKMAPSWLTGAAWLHLRAGNNAPLLPVLERLAGEKNLPDPRSAVAVLSEATRSALLRGQVEPAMRLWDLVPPGSNLQPAAAREQGQYLLWWTAEFDKAEKMLSARAVKDGACKRAYGQALVLNQKSREGAKVLEQLPLRDPPERQAALSGAMARTVEYYLNLGDWETGDENWEQWQARHPTGFLDGYAVLLKVRLIELRKQPIIAAKLAEAFARAMPDSSYAPQLLDRSAALFGRTDPARSAALRQLLQQRYPEDRLSQSSTTHPSER